MGIRELSFTNMLADVYKRQVVHGSCAAQFLVAHFQHIQAGEGTVGFVYTGDGIPKVLNVVA